MNEETKEVLEVVKEMFNVLNGKIDTIQSDLTEVKSRVTKMESHLENETDRNIKVLFEVLADIRDKTDCLPEIKEDIADIKIDIKMLKSATVHNSEEITRLKIVK